MRAFAIVALAVLPLGADEVKVGGEEFIPKGLIFSESDPKSRVAGEGDLADGCEWVLESDTRVAARRVEKESPEQDCVQYFYRTRVELLRRCPAPASPEIVTSERTTNRAPICPDAAGSIDPPAIEARAISSGETPDGQRQQIIVHPDGTRLTLQWNSKGISVGIRYTDGTTDRLVVKSKLEGE